MIEVALSGNSFRTSRIAQVAPISDRLSIFRWSGAWTLRRSAGHAIAYWNAHVA